tara:strand:- start:6037 stop:7437 length:1401 start_codon:yes stop_codon:yes gene_type:complete
MLFNSIDFVIFLPIVLALYWLVVKKYQNLVLLAASYFFYGWWDWHFLALILFSSLVDYNVAKQLEITLNPSKRKVLLYISICTNLGLLGFFKYFNFFAENFVEAFTILGYKLPAYRLDIILPVGISFYTFQTLSYTIDVYRKKIHPTKSVITFLAFVSFFPQLVAGPIERAANLIPQFLKPRDYDKNQFFLGIRLILWGAFLKIVVADRAAIYVNTVYNNVENHDGLTFIIATILFSFQIYGDFAGYSLIAIGTAKLFNLNLMTNFNRPYFSSSIREFWQRWHISLSTWFRDYLYIPLGGNRRSKPRWLLNILITFVISGLWHGANWTFIAWGSLNGLYIIIELVFLKKIRLGIINVFFTFLAINFSWIFFRANNIKEAIEIIQDIIFKPGNIFIGSGDDIASSIYAFIAVFLLLLVEIKDEYFSTYSSITNNKYQIIRLSAYSILIFIIIYLGVFNDNQFIYFQF